MPAREEEDHPHRQDNLDDVELGERDSEPARAPDQKRMRRSLASMSTAGRSVRGRHCCEFPIDLSDYCCPFVPKALTVIQDTTHVIIIIGVLATFATILFSIMGLLIVFIRPVSSCFQMERMFCSVDAISLIGFFGAAYYMWKLSTEYDEQIIKKRAELKERQHETTEAYSATARDMETALAKNQESNAGLAEKTFEGRRRDFERFLKSTKTKLRDAVLSKDERDNLLREFRKFIKQWFTIFEEASLDPVNKPFMAELDEIDALPTIEMIIDFVLETLANMKVTFISNEKNDFDKAQKEAQVEAAELLGRRNSDDSLEAPKTAESEAERKQKAAGGGTAPLMSDKSHSYNFDAEDGPNYNRGCSTPSWIHCGVTAPEIAEDVVDPLTELPRNFWCGCCTLTLLSRDHAGLMSGIFFGTIALVLSILPIWLAPPEGESFGRPMPIAIALAFSLFALVIILLVFEDVDQVQQLQREVNGLKEKTRLLKDKHEKMKQFWEDVQELTDLWLHRSIPRLEMLKEAQSHLEDVPPEQMGRMLMLTNECVAALEVSVGDRRLWKAGGAISDDDKKAFGTKVMALSDGKDLPEVLQGLKRVNVMIADRTRRASLDVTGMFQEVPGGASRNAKGNRRDSTSSMRSAESIHD